MWYRSCLQTVSHLTAGTVPAKVPCQAYQLQQLDPCNSLEAGITQGVVAAYSASFTWRRAWSWTPMAVRSIM
jgi:hypothetical protein